MKIKDANMFVSNKMPATMLFNMALYNVVLYSGCCFESAHYLKSATLHRQVMAGLLMALMCLITAVCTLLIRAVQFEMKTGLMNELSKPNLKPEDVEKIISGLKNSKSTGADYINTWVIKLVAREIAWGSGVISSLVNTGPVAGCNAKWS